MSRVPYLLLVESLIFLLFIPPAAAAILWRHTREKNAAGSWPENYFIII